MFITGPLRNEIRCDVYAPLFKKVSMHGESRLMMRFVVFATLVLSVVFGGLVSLSLAVSNMAGYQKADLVLYQLGVVSNGRGGYTSPSKDGLYLWDSRRNIGYHFQTGCRQLGFSWSPTGAQIALSAQCPNAEPGIYLMDYNGQNLQWLTEGLPTFGHFQWSPDSAYLFYNDNRSSQIISISLNIKTGAREMYAIRDLASGKFDLFSDEVVDPSDYPPRQQHRVEDQALLPPVPHGWYLLRREVRPVGESITP
jgi:hypothetical protein